LPIAAEKEVAEKSQVKSLEVLEGERERRLEVEGGSESPGESAKLEPQE